MKIRKPKSTAGCHFQILELFLGFFYFRFYFVLDNWSKSGPQGGAGTIILLFTRFLSKVTFFFLLVDFFCFPHRPRSPFTETYMWSGIWCCLTLEDTSRAFQRKMSGILLPGEPKVPLFQRGSVFLWAFRPKQHSPRKYQAGAASQFLYQTP